MANWLVVTDNLASARQIMNGFTGTKQVVVGGNGQYIYWEWVNASDTDVATLQASGHGQILPLVPLAMVQAGWIS